MPRSSEELTHARKEEIINACAALYETMGFRDITIRDIGERTSFTRTSIYNYFQTKEEIFLALLQREHEAWIADLEEIARREEPMTPERFADALARTLEKRGCMLKLESMNLYDMEGSRCLERCFPQMTQEEVQTFLYAFFPFLFGVYPYSMPTEKQEEAMKLAHVRPVRRSVYQLVRSLVVKLLS